MKEQVISLKTAKLASEKGFDLKSYFYYHPPDGKGNILYNEIEK
jgi:hypothetical protein